MKPNCLSSMFLIVLLAILILSSSASGVRGPQDIAKTVHNLSSSAPDFGGAGSPYRSTNEDEICIFCHTPHGGSLNGPLWNKVLPASTSFTHYNSASLSTQVGASNRAVNDESLLCMACHDGSLAVHHVLNPSNDTGGQPADAGGTVAIDSNTGTKIGVLFDGVIAGDIGDRLDWDNFGMALEVHGDLTDDHPISFSYNSVVGNPPYSSGDKVGHLRDLPTAEGKGVRFFGAGKRLECSSCHDPHVDYYSASGDPNYTPFLIKPNTNSQLCLSCHVK